MNNDLYSWLASRGLGTDAITELHPPSQLPVKAGVWWVEFRTNGGDIGAPTASGWCYYNGTFWGVTVSRPWMAKALAARPGLFQAKYWRGLKNEMKA